MKATFKVDVVDALQWDGNNDEAIATLAGVETRACKHTGNLVLRCVPGLDVPLNAWLVRTSNGGLHVMQSRGEGVLDFIAP